MIRELTKQFPSLWARISDSDGEFLLVEAANVLPKWLSPENDANRAWIHGGQLRIIPLQPDCPSTSKRITLPEAVRAIQSTAQSLIHSSFVEAEAFYRLEKYPGQIQDSIHQAVVTIPRRLAYVLHELPKAIAPAVEAFYLRDPLSLKRLESTSGDHLTFPPSDLVDVSVKFTKVLYAQLKCQRFGPPPLWLPKFASLDKEVAPTSSQRGENIRNMLELGMKVTCGFEMLVVNASKSKNRTARELALLLEDLADDGDSILPKDEDIALWKDSRRDDDDSWMDIDFNEFDKELNGKRGTAQDKSFGDINAHTDLRKIVSRFEAFLNDDKAGIDGAELDEMDVDDDEDDSDLDEDSGGEDRDVSFDEEEFARMMREMMGLPAERTSAAHKGGEGMPNSTLDEQEQQREDEEIRKLSEQMESELNEHGALSLNPTSEGRRTLKGKGKDGSQASEPQTRKLYEAGFDEEDSENEEVDIDYNLARNLLESFKGQAGQVGPVGTILADMGIRLPRDEGDDEED